ncbi:hypothetical protein H6F93_20095 [Leptolyngbya sp. FACHB-671]|uniref:type V CRISPR-associated protein Cas12k n=1 Tax=Leptolyngbya sp. FACHB-671 TaxID=2692812 RepID=UPI0016879D3A|nr:type V CRISPR-associated protein Cas12k [Leptolyngbya sp. FACHB-671]MBD2069785.1 hypothetical protein [Leptolyngbya sp. FACHB-671]
MSLFTIRARVIPSERTASRKVKRDVFAYPSETVKREFWNNSVIVSDLAEDLRVAVADHKEFETWRRKGEISGQELKKLWNTCRANSPYKELPERLARSAWFTIEIVYNSWFALRQDLQLQIDKLTFWLNVAKADVELVEACGCELEQIKTRAHEILTAVKAQLEAKESEPSAETTGQNQPQAQTKTTQKKQSTTAATRSSKTVNSLIDALIEKYTELKSSDPLSQCAIAHLIKNEGRVAKRKENTKQFLKRVNAKKKRVERLEVQLAGSMPRGRDLTGAKFVEALETATHQIPKDNDEFQAWQANLLRRPKNAPYPILFQSSDDLNWCLLKRRNSSTAQEAKDRIYVHFKGTPGEQVFEICCGCRQLSHFQQFLKDWEIFSSNQDEYSASPFLFRSAALIWKERQDTESNRRSQEDAHPWDRYDLYLHCAIEHHALTEAGTELLIAQKSAEANRLIKSYETKQETEELTEKQQEHLNKLQSQLKKLENPYPRPKKPLYKGNSDIVVGLAFSRKEVVTVAVINGATGRLITYRNVCQLLGKNYSLLAEYRLKQKHNAHQRHKDQVQGRTRQITESEQGKYLDRLIAKAIVELACKHRAGSIAMPNVKGIRERLVSAIEARAEESFPGDVEKQDAYSKQYKINYHNWSYGRLAQFITDKAEQSEIKIERGFQPIDGMLTAQAEAVARSALERRKPHTA